MESKSPMIGEPPITGHYICPGDDEDAVAGCCCFLMVIIAAVLLALFLKGCLT